jgi:hypothetical protein
MQMDPLGVDNYWQWKRDIAILLKFHDLWDISSNPLPVVPGAEGKPAAPDAETIRKDVQANSIIQMNVANHHKTLLAQCGSARESLGQLERLFQQQTVARQCDLRTRMATLAMDTGESVMQYYARAADIVEQLGLSGAPVPDVELAPVFLRGLAPEFLSIAEFLTFSNQTA